MADIEVIIETGATIEADVDVGATVIADVENGIMGRLVSSDDGEGNVTVTLGV